MIITQRHDHRALTITMYYPVWPTISNTKGVVFQGIWAAIISHHKTRQRHILCLSCLCCIYNNVSFAVGENNSPLTSPAQPLVRFISHFSFQLWIVLLGWYDSGYLVTKKEFFALLIKDRTKKLRCWLKGIPLRDIQWVGNFDIKLNFILIKKKPSRIIFVRVSKGEIIRSLEDV